MNKVIIITGSSRGIGAATASLAAKKGYAVCLTYLHNQEAANKADFVNYLYLKFLRHKYAIGVINIFSEMTSILKPIKCV